MTWRALGAAAAGIALMLLAGATPSAAKEKPAPTAAAPAPAAAYAGHVYLFRGLAGSILSKGINTFMAELDALGIPATADSYTRWEKVANAALAAYKADPKPGPVIIVGHSFGANAAVIMANWLGARGVPVRLVVTFDGVRDDMPALDNSAAELIDFYKPPFGRATKVVAGFKGKVSSTSFAGRSDITHDTIDKDPELHRQVIARIVELMKIGPKPKPKAKKT
ncbi:MAG TPA: thioesterase domain-containing protein [Bauldia sp.]|nr:thioesterase domain-containing protein [Bauldia sp.]